MRAASSPRPAFAAVVLGVWGYQAGFTPEVLGILERLKERLQTDKAPMVLGLHGDWGSGKTSALRALCYHLTGDDLRGEFSSDAFGRGEARGLLGDRRVGRAARDFRARAKEFVEVQGLQRVVRADAVVRGHAGHLGGLGRLLGAEATLDVGGGDERLVGGAGDDVKDFAHG